MKWDTVEQFQQTAQQESPFSLLVLAVLAAFFAYLLIRTTSKRASKTKAGHYQRRKRRNGTAPKLQDNALQKRAVPPQGQNAHHLADPRNQLDAIAKVNFEKSRLMNKTEHRVYTHLSRIIHRAGSGHILMAQTSLGELLRPHLKSGNKQDRDAAYASINSKRLDLAIIDRFGLLTVAVEVQGSGHYHKNTFIRDAVKREALRRAGIRLIEVTDDWTPEMLEQQIMPQLGREHA